MLALSRLFMLPSVHSKDVGVRIASFRTCIPTPPILCLRFACVPRDTQRKTRGRAVRYSFLVRLFHPLLHAGLARRTAMAIFRQLRPCQFGLVQMHSCTPTHHVTHPNVAGSATLRTGHPFELVEKAMPEPGSPTGRES